MQIWHGNANEDSGRHNIEATSYVQVIEHPKSSRVNQQINKERQTKFTISK